MKNTLTLLIFLVLSGCKSQNKTSASTDSQAAAPDSTKVVRDTKSGRSNTPNEFKDENAVVPLDINKTNPANIDSDNGNNNTPPADASGSADNPLADALTDNGEGAIIFVGIFARWNYQAGEQYDGSYDTTHNLFVLCASNQCHKVPRSQVAFQQFGSCDTAIEDRLKMFKIQKNGSIDADGNRIRVAGDKGFIKVGNATRVIQLDRPTIKRVNKAYIFNRENALQFNGLKNGQKEVTGKTTTLQKELASPAEKNKQLKQNTFRINEKPLIQQERKVTPLQSEREIKPELQLQKPAENQGTVQPAITQKTIENRTTVKPLQQQPAIRRVITDTLKPVNKFKTLERKTGLKPTQINKQR